MGGGAFAHAVSPGEPTLNTARLTPEDYDRLKNIYLQRLEENLPSGRVSILKETPEKSDYGDLDVFVAIDEQVDLKALATGLGAVGVICHSDRKCSLAVRKDGTSHDRTAVVYKTVQEPDIIKVAESATATAEKYAQLDIDFIPIKRFSWHSFYTSYGDMVGILGRIVTNLGFKITDKGFWLRMRELDISKKLAYVNIADKDGEIFLSDDSTQVMRFLGLSAVRFNEHFKTVNEMYEWVGECRILSAEALQVKRDISSDRNREQKRLVHARFFNEWLPTHKDISVEQTKEEQKAKLFNLRQQYVEDAVDFFSKRGEFEAKHSSIVATTDNATAANLLKPLISEHCGRSDSKHLNEILRAFRRHVGVSAQGQPRTLTVSHSDAESELRLLLGEDRASLKDASAMSEWVKANWDDLRTLERQRAEKTKAVTVENV